MDDWEMINEFVPEWYFEVQIEAIKQLIWDKFHVKYDENNKKLKKVMDVQMMKLYASSVDPLPKTLKFYAGMKWIMTRIDGHTHLKIKGGYVGDPIVRDNFTWEVNGNFDCSERELTSLEGCPRFVRSFDCYSNNLTSLKGCPEVVDGDFSCNNNMLTSLEHCPKVFGSFNCHENQIESLKGCPKVIEGDFDCSVNKLKSLEYGPDLVEGDFNCYDNYELDSLDYMPKVMGFTDTTDSEN
jgi:hypothetical protein